MNYETIQQRIYDLVDELDKITEKWAKSKADFEYRKEMRKVTLNVAKNASDAKTESQREREAYSSDRYQKFLWKAFQVDCEYFSLEGKKTLLENELRAQISLLSFEKSQIQNTI